jgi:predicted small metal-binding protein
MPSSRKVIDCRNFPSEKNCTLAISGTEEEVLDLAVLHATTVHGHQNTPELRDQIRSLLKDEPEVKAATA